MWENQSGFPMSENSPLCFDPFQGCPALAFLEKRLDKIDDAVDRIVELLTNQAVQGQQIGVQQQQIKEHTEALAAGRDRFNAMDIRVAQLSATCDGVRSFKSWVATSGLAAIISVLAVAASIYVGK